MKIRKRFIEINSVNKFINANTRTDVSRRVVKDTLKSLNYSIPKTQLDTAENGPFKVAPWRGPLYLLSGYACKLLQKVCNHLCNRMCTQLFRLPAELSSHHLDFVARVLKSRSPSTQCTVVVASLRCRLPVGFICDCLDEFAGFNFHLKFA